MPFPFDEAARIEALRREPAAARARDSRGQTPLHRAAFLGLAGLARTALELGADPDALDHEGRTPLMLTFVQTTMGGISYPGRDEIARLLIERVNEIDRAGPDGLTALHLALGGCYPLPGEESNPGLELVRALILRGADPNARTERGETCLHLALFLSSPGLLEFLLAHGAEVNAQDGQGESALFKACLQAPCELLRLLLSHRANPDLADARGETPLHRVADCIRDVEDGLARAELLLGAGARPDLPAADGRTPLHLACRHGSLALVTRLLQAGAGPDRTGPAAPGAQVPLIEALGADQPAIAELLLAHGAAPEARDRDGRPALDLAARWGWLELVRALIGRGAALDATDRDGGTALHQAALWGHLEVCRALLEAGANASAADRFGQTALLAAAGSRRLELAELLLSHGADPNARRDNGETPLYHAELARDPAMQALLRRHGAR
ncbi:MAG TPA: ankyrin repeat domain-containing protein [Myxococcota bacterium]|nr:ankyrin repeat domain-containing protein [Myxococcota bacterium]HRY96244.1 ankyrin repeat domain-containing protein [Myxococcota bacterium]